MSIKILDCTLRDGGYYTNWDFSKALVDTYIQSCNDLPIDYLEVGYRSNPMKEYLGEYFYCPIHLLEELKSKTNKKLVIILNEKDVRPSDVVALLAPCVNLVTMVRIALDPKQFSRALKLAEEIKKLGFEVGFNVMYMSKWGDEKEFLQSLKQVEGLADIFYMVDSYGGVYPEDIRNVYNLVKSKADIPIGFHGHNNLELGLINTLTAIDCGSKMVDSTITGMGRGAGNTKTELLLTSLNAKGFLDFDFSPLAAVVDGFTELQKKHEWGTNLPYMVSGANSLPQKDVMDWVGKRYYSFNSIIQALQNQKKGVEDNERFPMFEPKTKYPKALIIGGGLSAYEHAESLSMFALKHKDMCIIHSSARNAHPYQSATNEQFFCLVGSEGHRLTKSFKKFKNFNHTCVLPAFPRKMGTYVPKSVLTKTYELPEVTFTSEVKDSHTSLALQTALELGVREIYVAGYDGYESLNVSSKEQELLIENENLFKDALKAGVKLVSLTATRYKSLKTDSIFAHL